MHLRAALLVADLCRRRGGPGWRGFALQMLPSLLSDLWNPNVNVEQFLQVHSYRSLLWQRAPIRPPLVRSLKVRLRLAEERVGTCARGVDWRCSRRWGRRVPGGVTPPSLPPSLPQGEGWAAAPFVEHGVISSPIALPRPFLNVLNEKIKTNCKTEKDFPVNARVPAAEILASAFCYLGFVMSLPSNCHCPLWLSLSDTFQSRIAGIWILSQTCISFTRTRHDSFSFDRTFAYSEMQSS